MDSAFNVLKKNGLPTEKQFPYNPYGASAGICLTSVTRIQITTVVTTYKALTDNEMIALINKSPLIASVNWDNWRKFGTNSGILSCNAKSGWPNHVVELCGYGPDYWWIKNSFGPTWGNKGFAKLSRNRTNRGDCYCSSTLYTYYKT
jgi:cathepsin L